MEIDRGSFEVCATHQIVGRYGEPFAYVFREDDAAKVAAVDDLLEALKPFARYLEVLQEMGGNTPKTGPYVAVSSFIAGDAEITVEDMIAARDAIAKATQP